MSGCKRDSVAVKVSEMFVIQFCELGGANLEGAKAMSWICGAHEALQSQVADMLVVEFSQEKCRDHYLVRNFSRVKK